MLFSQIDSLSVWLGYTILIFHFKLVSLSDSTACQILHSLSVFCSPTQYQLMRLVSLTQFVSSLISQIFVSFNLKSRYFCQLFIFLVCYICQLNYTVISESSLPACIPHYWIQQLDNFRVMSDEHVRLSVKLCILSSCKNLLYCISSVTGQLIKYSFMMKLDRSFVSIQSQLIIRI